MHSLDEGVHILRIDQRRPGGLRGEERGDLLKANTRALKLVRAGQFGRLSLDDLVELRSNVPHITLKILMHGAGVAIPLGRSIAGRRETIIGAAEEVPSHGQLYERTLIRSAPIATPCRPYVLCLAHIILAQRAESYTNDSEGVQQGAWSY